MKKVLSAIMIAAVIALAGCTESEKSIALESSESVASAANEPVTADADSKSESSSEITESSASSTANIESSSSSVSSSSSASSSDSEPAAGSSLSSSSTQTTTSSSSVAAPSAPVESTPAHVHDFTYLPATCIYTASCRCGARDGIYGDHRYGEDGICYLCGAKKPAASTTASTTKPADSKPVESKPAHVHDFSYRLGTCVSPAYCECGANDGKLDKNFHQSTTNGICDYCGAIANPADVKPVTSTTNPVDTTPTTPVHAPYERFYDTVVIGDNIIIGNEMYYEPNGDLVEILNHEVTETGFDLTLAYELYGYTKGDLCNIFRERGYEDITAGSGSTDVEKVTSANGNVTYRFENGSNRTYYVNTHWYNPYGEIPQAALDYYYAYIY